MDAIIKPIEKMKPFFDKVARNKYLKAIKDGFITRADDDMFGM